MNDADDADDEGRMDELERHAIMLREHFDCVQIVALRHADDDDGTACYAVGKGNYYARVGAVKEWVLKQDRRSQLEVEL